MSNNQQQAIRRNDFDSESTLFLGQTKMVRYQEAIHENGHRQLFVPINVIALLLAYTATKNTQNGCEMQCTGTLRIRF